VRRHVLGTAGHVDHGKTTLVRALTGVDTDRLAEEKRRGITIELGFAPWRLDDGLELSLIDVPGHRKLVHTMIAGAVGMELVLLVVAADEGVMPQTREHVAACELLGIKRAVVAVTKLDRAGEDIARLAGEEALELLGDRFEATVAICSAKTGEGLDAVRAAVRDAVTKLPPRPTAARARLSVDRAFSVKGAGTVVTGTLVEGKLSVGDALALSSDRGVVDTSARGLHVHDHAVEIAASPTRLAVNLAGVALEDVRRGDVLTPAPGAAATRRLDVALRSPCAAKDGQTVQVHLGTARAPARLELGAALDDVVTARLRLGKPLVAFGGDRFVLRGHDVAGPSGAVVGGGVVLDAEPPRRHVGKQRAEVLGALAKDDAPRAMRLLVEEASPRALPSTAVAARFSIDAPALRRAADQLLARGEIAAVSAAGGKRARLVGWAVPAALEELADRAAALVAGHHAKAPLDRGMPLETLRAQLAARAGADVAEDAIARAKERRGSKQIATRDSGVAVIVVEGDVARMATFVGAEEASAAAETLERARAALEVAALKGVTEHAAGVATSAEPRAVKAALAKLVRDAAAVHAGDLWFSRASYDELKSRVVALLAKDGRMTIAAFKDLSGLGRRQAILLLEQLDRDGTTRRDGDDRLPASAPRSR
jgi:selenocysteine-specific elongation factor